MLDQATHRPQLQRAHGRAAVGLRLKGRRTTLQGLDQAGCAKAMLPRVAGDPEVVFLNTAGGLTGGDTLSYRLDLEAGGNATATTQTAERAYASTGDCARVTVDLHAGAGASLDWLPQETILFDGSSLDRTTRVTLAGDAGLLMCESVVLGRTAMGESINRLMLKDRREIWRGSRPVLIDPFVLTPEILDRRANPALLGQAQAFGLIVLAADGAEDAAGGLRALPLPEAVTAAASGWDGRTVVRLTARDGWPLKQAIAILLSHLRRKPLPRVWQI